jgi:hypothetical protein
MFSYYRLNERREAEPMDDVPDVASFAEAVRRVGRTWALVIERYRAWLRDRPWLISRARQELKGKRLGCYCAPKPCHGDVLARVAEGGTP